MRIGSCGSWCHLLLSGLGLLPEEQASYTYLLQTYIPKIVAAASVLQLGKPEYCTFLNMLRFEPKHLLFCAS